ncbi:prevent-host-death family protein, putative [Synechococcus sp. PCC 7335]|uniref:type II toxin-antitoxin system Phd/YefM family antitoxin n=1 Tax=Synechococcus sp. (strain ATCC 29403 / PCC 7335) TaxID=91464 RepID=UPI00017ED2B9|nr:type II toxin-antitoxin system Phd/YefM family antitoxin [Synechococcus sp. PCC 7335]EDX82893.1 prevent-host-death family protein, putative [Synechococcus sp. PCC 7335]
MYSISSREFNQDVSKAKRATEQGPVFITNRGTPAYVLLTVEDYHKLVGNTHSVADLLSMLETNHDAEIDFDPVRSSQVTARTVDLS